LENKKHFAWKATIHLDIFKQHGVTFQKSTLQDSSSQVCTSDLYEQKKTQHKEQESKTNPGTKYHENLVKLSL
jgi:hypothetical protein